MNDAFLGLVDGPRHIEDGLPPVEPFFLQPPDASQQDDAMLDDWLASLMPDRFGDILDSLSRLSLTSVASAG